MTVPMARLPIARLMEGAIDYAGMFPPSALPLPDAVAEWNALRVGPEAKWVRRFAVLAERLPDLEGFEGEIAAIGRTGEWDIARAADAADLNDFLDRNPKADVGAYEVRVDDFDAIESRLRDLRGFTACDVFVELPLKDGIADVLAEISDREDFGAKARTGGLSKEAFPDPAKLATFIQECMSLEVPFKLTAGLHEPLFHLNPELDTHRFGFVNVLAAPALAIAGDLAAREIENVLTDGDAANWRITDRGIVWRGLEATLDDIDEGRAFLESFGSCSVAEPLAGLKRLGWA